MVSSHDSHEAGKLHLLSLPQELQDNIFDLAYGQDLPKRITSRHNWELRERDKFKTAPRTYKIRPFPACKIEEFLISKKFFLSASKAFMSAQGIAEKLARAEIDGVGIAYAFATVCESFEPRFWPSKFPPNTKVYQLPMGKWDFYNFDSLGIVEDEVTDDDLKATESFCALSRLRGLQDFRVKSYESWSHETIHSSTNDAPWAINIRRFEALVREQVTQPKERDDQHDDDSKPGANRDALYIGSLISCHSSKTLHETREKPSAVATKHDIAVSKTTTTTLRSKDIPETVEGLQALLLTSGGELVDWVKQAKKPRATGLKEPKRL